MALGYMRRHRRWLFVFLWLVIAAFVILYVPAFRGADAGSPGELVGRVGGLPITLGDFRRDYVRQRQMYERIYQGRLDGDALRSLGIENQVFEGIVSRRLVDLEARRLGIAVDDETLAREISRIPQFQQNGRFVGGAEVQKRLELQGMSPTEFEEALRSDLLRQRLEALITDGIRVGAADVEREFRRQQEQLKAEYVLVDASRFRSQATADQAEIQARFEARKESYRIPEKRVAGYVLVDTEALKARVTVTDRDVEAHYQEHRDDFRQQEEVCTSHIQVNVRASADAKEGHPEAEAKKIAQGLLDQVRGGADFAAVARKSSEDKGSAASGGDMHCSPRGQMPPEYENAAFSLDPGQTSDLVKTSHGYHIVKVSSRREEAVLPLSQVKDRIRAIVHGQRVQAMAEEKAQAIGASLSRGRSLEEAAAQQGVTVQKSAPFARGETSDPLSSPTLVARAFELKKGEINHEGFRVGRGYVFISLLDVQPSRVPELKEVEERVKADLLEEKSYEKARQTGAELKAQAERLGLEKAASGLRLLRKETQSFVTRGQAFGDLGSSVTLDEAVFALPEKTLSDPVRVSAGYAVVRALEKKPFDPLALEKQRLRIAGELTAQRRAQAFQAYQAQLRQRVVVERYPEAIRRVLG